MDQHHQSQYKIVVIGMSGVGKTSLILRHRDDCFIESPSIIEAPITLLDMIAVNYKTIELQIWDTAGQETSRTQSGYAQMYNGIDAVIIVFDLTDMDSFHSVPNWIDEVNCYARPRSADTLVLLAGNKADLDNEHIVGREAAEDMAIRNEIDYVEVSAKTGYGVKAMFEGLPNKLIEKFENENKASRKGHETHVMSTGRNISEETLSSCCCNIC